jgi:enamine deaminase RidA (YjgF/YER057c/UK114 family)
LPSAQQSRLNEIATALGYEFSGEIKIGVNCVSTVRERNMIHVSGRVPRVGGTIVTTRRVVATVTAAAAQLGAKVCALHALVLLAQATGSLDHIEQILHMTVYTQSAEDFAQQSEVADSASDVLHAMLGDAGKHTRTTVGIYQLPKNASVELDLVAAVRGIF